MEVASLVARFSVEGERAIPNAAMAADRAIDKVGDSADRNTGRVGGFFSGMGGLLLGGALIGGVGALGGALLNASADAETMRNSLNIAVGDVEEAGRIFDSVQKLSAATPFAFPELMESTVALESFGMESERWLGTIGDTAAGTGKSINQVTEAVLDAQTGSYERLKELGIMTRVEGDKLTFSYMENGKKIEQTVDRTNQELVNSTLQGIWNSKYEGAMEVQSKSFTGQWSTLKDNVMLRLQEMTTGIFGFATKALGFLNDVFAKGWRVAVEDAFGSTTLDIIEGALSTLQTIGETAMTGIALAADLVVAGWDGIVSAWDRVSGPLGDAWDAATTLAQGFADAFDAGQSVETILGRMPGSLQGVTKLFLELGDAIGDLWRGYQQGGFAEVGDRLIGEIAQVASAIPGALIDLALAFDDGVRTLIENVDWHGVGEAMGGKVRDVILSLPAIIRENWKLVGIAAAGFAVGLPFMMFRNIKMLVPKAIELIDGFIEGLDIQWAQVALWFAGVPVRVLDALPGLLATLLVDGYQLLDGFRTGIEDAWDERVYPWLFATAARALMALPDLGQTFVAEGAALIFGFATGIADSWNSNVAPIFWGVPATILAALPDISNLLYNIGIGVVAGMARGLYAGAHEVIAAVGYLAGLIPDGLKSLLGIDSPSKVMRDLFQAVPAGAALGIMDGTRSIQGAAARMALAAVPGVGVPRMSIGGVSGGAMRSGVSAGGRGVGGTVIYDLRGAVIGDNAERWIEQKVAQGASKVMDRAYSRNRMAEARA